MRTVILLTSVLLQFHCEYFAFAYNDDSLILLNAGENDDLGGKFLKAANDIGYHVVRQDNNSDLEATLTFSQQFNVVVNFEVFNFGNVTVSDLMLQMLTDDIIIEHYGILNNSLKCDKDHNETNAYGRICNDPAFNKKTKLFKGSLEEHGALYNIFKDITEDSYKYLPKRIVNCLDYCDSYYSERFITCEQCDKEFECQEGTIAIIAPSPENIKTSCDENIPIIFYDTLYIETESLETYPNIQDYDFSATIVHWKALSSITNNFVVNHWNHQRIAIVSDDSMLSNKMKNDQKEYFDHKNILYAMHDCFETEECVKVLTLLKEVKAPIIIVNIAKYNLNNLIRSAQKAGVTNDDIIWVFPGHKSTEISTFKYKSFINVKPNPSRALEFVIEKYKNSLGNETKFKQAIRNYKPPVAYNYYNPDIEHVPSYLLNQATQYPQCVVQTKDFYYPCADWPLLYIITTLIIFLILIFFVLLFFNHIQMNTLEYRPLHRPRSIWRQIFRKDKPAEMSFNMRPFRQIY